MKRFEAYLYNGSLTSWFAAGTAAEWPAQNVYFSVNSGYLVHQVLVVDPTQPAKSAQAGQGDFVLVWTSSIIVI